MNKQPVRTNFSCLILLFFCVLACAIETGGKVRAKIEIFDAHNRMLV